MSQPGVKISELPELSSVTNDDLLIIVDSPENGGSTRKIKFIDFITALSAQINNGFGTGNEINNNSLYKGYWNPNTNEPDLINNVFQKGEFYRVEANGNFNLGGNTNWFVNDIVIFNGLSFDRIAYSNGNLSIANWNGTWDAVTNIPTLQSGVGTENDTYIVTSDSTINLDNISDWRAGDIAIFRFGSWTRIRQAYQSLPSDDNSFKGVWNAATNTPALLDTNGLENDVYVVNVPGNTNLGGNTTWEIGDLLIKEGSSWVRIPNGGGTGNTTINNTYQDSLYLGHWDANTNTPQIDSGVGNEGQFYTVIVRGSSIVDGVSTWEKNDRIQFINGVWERAEYSIGNNVTNTNSWLGSWDADNNIPQIQESVGEENDTYVVSYAGSTPLNGISDWSVGDLITRKNGSWTRVRIDQQTNSNTTEGLYKGVWNAATNTPSLTSSVGTEGEKYIVSNAGATTLDGISKWSELDEIYFDDGIWKKRAYFNPLDAQNYQFKTAIVVGGNPENSDYQFSGSSSESFVNQAIIDAYNSGIKKVRLDLTQNDLIISSEIKHYTGVTLESFGDKKIKADASFSDDYMIMSYHSPTNENAQAGYQLLTNLNIDCSNVAGGVKIDGTRSYTVDRVKIENIGSNRAAIYGKTDKTGVYTIQPKLFNVEVDFGAIDSYGVYLHSGVSDAQGDNIDIGRVGRGFVISNGNHTGSKFGQIFCWGCYEYNFKFFQALEVDIAQLICDRGYRYGCQIQNSQNVGIGSLTVIDNNYQDPLNEYGFGTARNTAPNTFPGLDVDNSTVDISRATIGNLNDNPDQRGTQTDMEIDAQSTVNFGDEDSGQNDDDLNFVVDDLSTGDIEIPGDTYIRFTGDWDSDRNITLDTTPEGDQKIIIDGVSSEQNGYKATITKGSESKDYYQLSRLEYSYDAANTIWNTSDQSTIQALGTQGQNTNGVFKVVEVTQTSGVVNITDIEGEIQINFVNDLTGNITINTPATPQTGVKYYLDVNSIQFNSFDIVFNTVGTISNPDFYGFQYITNYKQIF